MAYVVPDFFQDDSEDGLRSQVQWAERSLGLDDSFFARLVAVTETQFSRWRASAATLTTVQETSLRDFWRMTLHLLSFQAFDEGRVRNLYEQVEPNHANWTRSAFTPPWSGSSLKQYLEKGGSEAIEQVNRWMESFKFGDPYGRRPEPEPCLSIRH